MKKQTKVEEWATNFLLTTNYKTWTQLCCDSVTPIFDNLKGYKKAVEVGENGNLHTHYFVAFKRSQRRETIINKMPSTDVKRVTPGTEERVCEYIGNHAKEEGKGATIIYTETWGDIDVTRGVRTDLNKTDNTLMMIKQAIDDGFSWNDLWRAYFPVMVRLRAGIKDYYDMVQEDNKNKYAIKTEDEIRCDIAEQERILLTSIADRVNTGTDLSRPLCNCGITMDWDVVDRIYRCNNCG